MKKRILALALCLFLVVPFVLTSCFTPDKGNEGGDTSLYNELKKMYYDEKEPTKAEALEIEGASGKLEDGFYSASKTTTSLDTLDTTTTYFIYNVHHKVQINKEGTVKKVKKRSLEVIAKVRGNFKSHSKNDKDAIRKEL